MKNLLLILALIALGYVAYQHYFKRQPQETKTPAKQEVKEPIDIPVPFKKKEVKQPQPPQQFQKKKAVTIEQPRKEATKITKPKIEAVKSKQRLSQSTKTAVTRIRRCIANGKYFEAATLCKTVKIPKGFNTERKFFISLVAEVDKGLEKTMLSKISYLENKKRKAETNYKQRLKKIKLQKSSRRAIGNGKTHRQQIIDEEYRKKKIVMKKNLTLKYNSYVQKINEKIRSTKSSIEQVRNTLRTIR